MTTYVVINGLMYIKINGEIGEVQNAEDDPIVKKEIEEVWDRYDKQGRPFMMYHTVGVLS